MLDAVCRQMVIPVEMLGMASGVPVSSASVVQLKAEGSSHHRVTVTSETASAAVSASSASVAASLPQLISIQPQFIVPLPSGGPSPEPAAIESDEASEPKRLRVAEEEWTSDSWCSSASFFTSF